MKREWTPTLAEARALTEAWARHACLRCMLPISLFLLAYVLLVVDDLRLALIGWLVLVAFVAVVQLQVLLRRTARLVARVYPVGRLASAEELDGGIRLVNAVETLEVRWDRFARPRPGAVVVSVRDKVLGRPVLLPRQLVDEAWLPLLGAREQV